MAKEILVECVVKPVLATAATMVTMAVVGVVATKIDKRRNKKVEAEGEEPEMA